MNKLLIMIVLNVLMGVQAIDPEDILEGHGQFDSQTSLEDLHRNWKL